MASSGSADRLPDRLLGEILGGVAMFRILVVLWALAVATIDWRSGVLSHPVVALTVLASALAWTATVGRWARTGSDRLQRKPAIAFDLVLAALIVVTDWVVYAGTRPQSFGSAWPAAAVVSSAAILGWRVGAIAGGALGSLNVIAAAVAGRLEGRGLAVAGSLLLLMLTGAVAGWVTDRLRRAESEVAEARAREEVARTLHDGVLQTLAVIQRRSDDQALRELAREQEWELRDLLERTSPVGPADLVSTLRRHAARVERDHAVRVELIVVDAPSGSNAATTALAGAAREALTNAAKHAAAGRISVCVDRVCGGTEVAVHDDGVGFDPETTPRGSGWTSSIVERLDEVGGRATIVSGTGRGTDVTLWVP